ncbi:hypothetical protein Golax_012221 [Gossypium laxum]|uniref:Uncharacterized protein n=1 Tax=Gossypium laxum TaxID=34288 RepID=A0A7J8ZMX4_9ROSI|nr:hypothetical protein [Gossypium laxum]
MATACRVGRLKSFCDDINRLNFPVSEPQPSGPRAVAIELDVCANGSSIQRCVKAAWDAFGRMDGGFRDTLFSNIYFAPSYW